MRTTSVVTTTMVLSRAGVTFTAGKVNQAFTFNGTDGEVVLPNYSSAPSLSFGPNDSFTLDVWIKPYASVLGTQRAAVSLTYVCSPESILLIVLVDGKIDFGVRDSLANAVDATSLSSILDGNWHHVTGVRDFNSHSLTLYLDGTSVSSVRILPPALSRGQTVRTGLDPSRSRVRPIDTSGRGRLTKWRSSIARFHNLRFSQSSMPVARVSASSGRARHRGLAQRPHRGRRPSGDSLLAL